MGKATRLTDLEIKIMRVLWKHEEPMTIHEISEELEDDKISVQSVKQCIRQLLAKKAVEVRESVLVSTVYARTFRACFTKEEFLTAECERLSVSVYGGKKSRISGVAVAMLCNNKEETVSAEEIERLQAYIDEKKEQMNSH